MLSLLLGLSAIAAQPRHALIIGANTGPQALGSLRYAEDDARRMAEVLTELGGFPADRVTVLYGPDVAEVSSALTRHAGLARAADDDLFVFYYSGHADNSGLRLGEETLPYAQLRRAVRDMPADVRVGVLDACRSGEITRIKGLEVSSPFAVDHGLSSEGEAWLTAATAEESAQESDLLKSSFFTHALITGLRGAADRDDGVVSLAEAYAYAYDSTVSRTGTSQNGVQHPAYDFRLQGRGDLPLTEVRRAEAMLVLPEDMEGQLHVLRAPDNALVAEIAKARGMSLTLGLPAGRYTLRLRDGNQVQEARIGLSAGSTLSVRGMQPAPLATASAKGEGATEEELALALPAAIPADSPALPVPAEPPTDPAAPPLRRGSRMLAGLDAKATEVFDRTAEKLDNKLSSLLDPSVAPRPERRLRVDAIAPSALIVPPSAEGCAEPELSCLSAQPGEDGLSDGPLILRSPEGQTLAEGELRGGLRVGRWTFWHPSGARMAEGAYDAGMRSGTWTWWYESGVRQRRGTYESGQPDGLWTDWYPNGNRRQQAGYDRGVAHGRFTAWFENGIHQREGTLRRGQPEGRWGTWYENGQRASRGEFHLGLMEGPWQTWHPNGRLASEGRYIAGAEDGRWQRWDENGGLLSQGRYRRGIKVGLWRLDDPNGDGLIWARYRDGAEVRRSD